MQKNFIILLIALAGLLLSCTTQKEPEELLIEAKSLIAKDDKNGAVIALKNLIQQTPKSGEARFLLGKVYLKRGDFINAEKELIRAKKLQYNTPELTLMLGKYYLQVNKTEQVITELGSINFTKKESEIDRLVMLGQAYLSHDEPEKGQKSIESAIAIDTSHPRSLLGQALLLSYNNDNEKALSVLEQLVNKNKSFSDAWLLKASVETKEKMFAQAAKSFREYAKLEPNNYSIRMLVAHSLIQSKEYDAAQKEVDLLLKVLDGHPTVNLLAAQLAILDKKYEVSKAYADQVLMKTNNGLAQIISGMSNYYLGNNEQAYYQLSAIADDLPISHKVHQALAILQLKLGYTNELYHTLDSMDVDDPETIDFLSDFGSILVKQGDTEKALQLFSRALDKSPNNALLTTKKGVLKVIKNNDSGMDDLKQAVELDSNLASANYALAMAYIKQGKNKEAIAVADNWIEKHPDNIAALLLRGNIAARVLDNQLAKALFEKVISLEPENITALFNLAVLYTNEEKNKLSLETIDKIFKIDIENISVYRLMMTNYRNTKQEDKLFLKLKDLIKNNPGAIRPRILISKLYNNKGEYTEANKVLEEMTNYKSLPTAYFIALANNYLVQKKPELIDDIFNKWQVAQPKNSQAFSYYIEFLDIQKKYSQALDVVQSTLAMQEHKNNFKLQTFEAYFLLINNKVEQAGMTIAKLAEKKPNDDFVQRIQGQLALVNGKYDEAVKFLDKSYQAKKNTFTGIYLANSYRALQQPEKAIAFLETEIKEQPNLVLYKKLLAEIYISNKPEKAIKQYQDLIEKKPTDVTSLNNLAWLLYKNNQLDKAYLYAKKAQEISPENPQVLDTYGIILFKQNKIEEAIVTLSKAHELAEKNVEIVVHLIDVYKSQKNEEKIKVLMSKLSDENKKKWNL